MSIDYYLCKCSFLIFILFKAVGECINHAVRQALQTNILCVYIIVETLVHVVILLVEHPMTFSIIIADDDGPLFICKFYYALL